MNLKKYFDRIAYGGTAAPTLETLRAVVRNHTASIPFENLDPFLGRPVDIGIDAVEQKLVLKRRGGYCFEHNGLLREVLHALGYQVSGLAARVLYMRKDMPLPPRSHMLLRLDINGNDYIADCGFGGATPTGPLKLEADIPQETPNDTYRLIKVESEWQLQVHKLQTWEPMYQFNLLPQLPVDYIHANYYVSTHPESVFLTTLMAARAVENGRYTLSNSQLSFHPVNGAPERQSLESPADIIQAVKNQFLINITGIPPDLEISLARLFQPSPVQQEQAFSPIPGVQ